MVLSVELHHRSLSLANSTVDKQSQLFSSSTSLSRLFFDEKYLIFVLRLLYRARQGKLLINKLAQLQHVLQPLQDNNAASTTDRTNNIRGQAWIRPHLSLVSHRGQLLHTFVVQEKSNRRRCNESQTTKTKRRR